MSTFTVITDCGKNREFDTRREAEKGRDTHEALCEECDEENVRIEMTNRSGAPGPVVDSADSADSGEPSAKPSTAPDPTSEELPAEMPDSVRTDPLDIIPGYMIDEVEGQPTINKRGYAVIANRFDIVVQSEAITTAGETDHEYAEFKATAWKKEDGPECGYTGHATARASEDRRGMADNLNEMAETRAMKRAVAWASGTGILAWEELAGYVDDDRSAAASPAEAD